METVQRVVTSSGNSFWGVGDWVRFRILDLGGVLTQPFSGYLLTLGKL